MNTLLKENLELRKEELQKEIEQINKELELIEKEPQKWSEEWIKIKIKDKVTKYFNGDTSNIKTIIFKTASNYDDEYYQYTPILILIDQNYNEIPHNIAEYDLVPNEKEQSDYYRKNNKDLILEDLTFKMND